MKIRRALGFAVALGMLASPAATRAAQPVKFTDVPFVMDDGVRLTADVYLPGDGDGPFPCVVELTPYRKEMRASEGVSFLPGAGIALIEVDARGTGGSEGEYDIVFSMREQLDAAAVVDMAADLALPGFPDACLDKVGMYGGSYSGIIQNLVATLPPHLAPAHLAAIAPQRAYGDLYRDIVYHGGQVIGSFGLAWSTATTALYTQPPTNVNTPQGQAAWIDHLTKNDPMMLHYFDAPYADATYTSNHTTPSFTQKLYDDSSSLPRIENLRVPVLQLAGWFDAFTRGSMEMFRQAHEQESDGTGRGPNYVIVGPWNHGQTHFITPEPKPGLRDALAAWYLHWLAGAPAPAFMAGARVQYYMMGTGAHLDATGLWHESESWPPAEVRYQRYYLREGGVLSPEAPGDDADAQYVYNPAAGTAEIASRWDNALAGAAYIDWDQRTDEPKGLTYTTAPFTEPLAIAGTINLHLRATSVGLAGAGEPAALPGLLQTLPPWHDTDFVVKLTDVDTATGRSTLITQGYLRGSHKAVDGSRTVFAPNGDVIAAFHPHTAASLQPLQPQDTFEIEIWPTAKTFAPGHALRIDIYSADTPNHLNLLKPALNTIHHRVGLESWLNLPVMPA
ncbi:MAG TPA: CocE/NonD family hydrolase [Actinomycetota bacterium]|nr:CocE/NonD family hydrolase [Actinomycetota bacterium]